MDWTTILIIVIVVMLIAVYLFRRSRPAPHGTYDDERVRSSGGIGGGTRGYDDPEHRSSGSIGGGTRGYDEPGQKSGGSIGGQQGDVEREPLDEERRDRIQTRKDRTDDDNFKSGGSIGG